MTIHNEGVATINAQNSKPQIRWCVIVNQSVNTGGDSFYQEEVGHAITDREFYNLLSAIRNDEMSIEEGEEYFYDEDLMDEAIEDGTFRIQCFGYPLDVEDDTWNILNRVSLQRLGNMEVYIYQEEVSQKGGV